MVKYLFMLNHGLYNLYVYIYKLSLKENKFFIYNFSGVNFLDLSIRQGQFENLPKLPFVPGFECAGEVVYLGPNTTGYTVCTSIIIN